MRVETKRPNRFQAHHVLSIECGGLYTEHHAELQEILNAVKKNRIGFDLTFSREKSKCYQWNEAVSGGNWTFRPRGEQPTRGIQMHIFGLKLV